MASPLLCRVGYSLHCWSWPRYSFKAGAVPTMPGQKYQAFLPEKLATMSECLAKLWSGVYGSAKVLFWCSPQRPQLLPFAICQILKSRIHLCQRHLRMYLISTCWFALMGPLLMLFTAAPFSASMCLWQDYPVSVRLPPSHPLFSLPQVMRDHSPQHARTRHVGPRF